VLKSRILLTSLMLCVLAASCRQAPDAPSGLPEEQQPLPNQTISLEEQLSPSIMSLYRSPDSVTITSDESVNEADFTAEYGKHRLFFTAIDKTGSAVEEILARDGYNNASKYLAHWRDLMGVNTEWPDYHSTTYHGIRPALEHGLLKNGTGWFWYRSAAQKADEYFSRAVMAYHKGTAPDAPEQQEAWEWLGRTAHFVQDVTVPHHTVTLARLGQLTHNPFEDSVDQTFTNYLPSLNYDGGAWNGNGPYPAQGQWGIYYQSKLPGEIIKSNADISRGLYKIANSKKDATNGNWDKVRALVLPLASKTCAGLIVSFLKQVGETP
jgi:hypothetical protein